MAVKIPRRAIYDWRVDRRERFMLLAARRAVLIREVVRVATGYAARAMRYCE